MIAIAPLGIAVFALQAVVGFGAYRFFATAGRASAAILGIVAALAGVVALLVVGLLWTFVLDIAILFVSAVLGTRFVETPSPS